MIIVRAATLDDVDDMSDVLIASITALCVADHRNDPKAVSRWLANKRPAGIRKWFANPDNKLFVAELDGNIAAVGAISISREIIVNYVSPEHRFRGVSKVLLKTMEVELGPGEATLTSTATALRFYRRMGWTDAGEVESFGGMVAYAMHKAI